MLISFDDTGLQETLYPLTATRSAADIRIGILTIREKWELISKQVTGIEGNTISIKANLLPTLQNAAAIVAGEQDENIASINYPWEIFQNNDAAIRSDFQLLTQGRLSQQISSTNKLINPDNIFLEEGAKIEHCFINAAAGPVYVGKNAELMEGCMIRGPFAIGEGSVVKMGTKVYGATTIGPYCIAGGEIKNSIMMGYSNKAHDGYLGDSVLGEWCNLGAGTSNSNIKNTASMVKAWSQHHKDFIPVGLKCGLIMGDYSRSAINTSFNTGTVAGVCCNIFDKGFPPKHIKDFSWGKEKYIVEKAIEDIDNWKKLKGKVITENEIKILNSIYYQ